MEYWSEIEYWSGKMNWPLEEGWKCETCGHTDFTWGLIHGVCRCDQCHTQYYMRIDSKDIALPICLLKEKYKEPAKKGWILYHKPISEWTDEEWDKVF